MNAALDPRSIATALGGKVEAGGRIRAPGPGHSKHDDSLVVWLDPSAPEGFRVTSHAGDDWQEARDYVRDRAGLPAWKPEEVSAPPLQRFNAKRRHVADHIYRDERGEPYLRVQRFEAGDGKTFSQQHWTGSAWVSGKPSGPKLPYRLPELLAEVHDTRFICEGEKNADALAALGLAATTASEGAGKWTTDLNHWFEGCTVYILADNDKPGADHARQVAHHLHGVADDVRIVNLPGLGPKGDVSDWLAAGGDGSTLVDFCKAQPKFAPDNESASEQAEEDHPTGSLGLLWAKPFVWRAPAEIPRREWLYGGHFIRRFLTTTMAPGGLGKSALLILEAICMASGKPLLGVPVPKRLRVWYWNGEDPLDETERRIAAIAMRYGLEAADLEGWLFVGSGRDADLIIAQQTRDGAVINAPHVDAVSALLSELRIDLAIIDPFVSSHRVAENDNGAIDAVAKKWARLADQANAGVELVHHMRKRQAGSDAEMTVEDGRGAVALIAAARSARVLNGMSAQDAEKAGIEQRRSYFKVDNGKSNLAPPPDKSEWRRFVGQDLGNGPLGTGDNVGVVVAWEWPEHTKGLRAEDTLAVQQAVAAGTYRLDPQSPEWVGYAVAKALNLNADRAQDRAKIKTLLRGWMGGPLIKVQAKDEKRNMRTFVEVGEWISPGVEVFE